MWSTGYRLVLLEAHGHLEGGIAIVRALNVLAGIDARGDLIHFVTHLWHIPQCGDQGISIELAIGHVTLFLHQTLGVALEVLIGIGLHAAGHEILELCLRHLVLLHALLHHLMEVWAALQKGGVRSGLGTALSLVD